MLSIETRSQVATWLLFGCFMIYIMVMIGGVTRLTGSGLSIIDWRLIEGVIPPLTHDDWVETFEKYQQYPEFQKRNISMDVHSFKSIFWWEYIHRMWGRLIGVVFIVPFIWFLFKRKLDKPLIYKLAIIGILGAMQGGIGWYMVKSGLSGHGTVSPYRLMLHLAAAFLTYSFAFWVALDLMFRDEQKMPHRRLRTMSFWITGLLGLQVIFGALMSGTKAALFFPTFPDMNGHIIPPYLFFGDPWFMSFFQDIKTIQFMHRLIAYVLAILIIIFWAIARKATISPTAHQGATFLLVVLFIQFILGAVTVVSSRESIPVTLALLHQAGAMMLLTAAVFMNYHLWTKTSAQPAAGSI